MLTKKDLSLIDAIVSRRIQIELEPVKKDLRTLKSDMTQTRKDVKALVNFFDREYLELRRRVERIEEHLHLPSTP
jgi:adenylosuccinate lyase